MRCVLFPGVRSFLLGAALLVGAAPGVLSLLPPSTVAANGRGTVVFQGTVGPYQAQVLVFPPTPRVGSIHLTVRFQEGQGSRYISDGTVLVWATPLGQPPDQGMPAQARNTLLAPTDYEIDLPMPTAGRWLLTLQLEGPQGPARLEVPLDVKEAKAFPWVAAAIMAAVLGPLVLWGLYRIRREDRGRTRRQESR